MGAFRVDGRAVADAERGSVLAILGSARGDGAASAIAQDAQSHADWLADGARRLIPPGAIACREGCAFCCHLRVITTIPEVLRIASDVRGLAPDERAALDGRIEAHRAATAGLDAAARRLTRPACPLLVDGRCSVYAIRPMSCRGWNSLDVQACEADFLDPSRLARTTIYAPQFQINAHVQEGMAAGREAAGLPHDRVELVAALRIALGTPDAEARWLDGEPIFEDAVVR
jgi:hypothetical protein